MIIGMIGAESKHVDYFCDLINKDKLFGSTRVAYIWGGDTNEDRLRSCAIATGIERITKTPSEVIDASEAIIITLRDGNKHTDYALECIKKRKPVFIDKPFTVDPSDSLRIIEAAKRYSTPFTGGSTLCFLPEIPKLRKKFLVTNHAELSYRADPDSPFGGWYFYGSHLTDLCAAICGENAIAVNTRMSNKKVFVEIIYDDNNHLECTKKANKKVQLYSAPDLPQPMIRMDDTYILDDNVCYFYGLKAFFDVIASGKSPDADRLLCSVKLMDAIMKSAALNTTVAIDN